MTIQIETGAWHEVKADWLIVGIAEDQEPVGPTARLDETLGGQISRLRERGDLEGKAGETNSILDVPALAADRLLLVGLGKPSELTAAAFEKTMQTAARRVSGKQGVTAAAALPESVSSLLPIHDLARIAATALTVGAVGQDLYQAEPGHYPLRGVSLLVESSADQAALAAAAERGEILGEAVNLTRELVNRTAGEIYPETFAARAQIEAAKYGLNCEVLDEHDLRKEKMGSLLAVAQGSDRPPRVVVLEHRGAGEEAATLALVGKGVTFDSGGLSLKPTEGMKDMKCDMAGAATVLGAMTAIARLKLPVNVVGYLGLVENMVSGSSYKLGDVLTARNGTTIEVLNTDAEGRLVLADVLSFAADRGADRMIDLATLTGACLVALGEEVTGAFTNSQEWCDQVLASAAACGEKIWQMPMFDEFAKLLNSDVADCKNIGPRWGGAITASKFLEKFVDEKPWVHLDIAGPSFASSNKPHREGGATGCMVRTLVETAETN